MLLVIAKVVSIILAVMAISKSYVDFREKRENWVMMTFWAIVWLGVVAVALFPKIVDKVVALSHTDRTGIGTIFGLALVFILFLVYRIYVKANRIEQQYVKLVRELGLKNLEEKRKKVEKKK